MKFAVIVEESQDSFGAYVPDLPGCIAVGESRAEVLELIQEAVRLHLSSLKERGADIPDPSSSVELIEVAA
jgi:predicted RNase H-like HicB family nuclease